MTCHIPNSLLKSTTTGTAASAYQAKSSSAVPSTMASRRRNRSYQCRPIMFLLGVVLCWIAPKTVVHAGQPRLLDTLEDDIYHCDDPTDDSNIIDCDPETYLWRIDELTPDAPPEECDINLEDENQIRLSSEALMDFDDEHEPCALWILMFRHAGEGEDESVASPTPAPNQSNVFVPVVAPVEPNEPPVGEPGQQARPSTGIEDSPAGDEEADAPEPMILDPIALTFFWPPNTLFSYTLDRSELHSLLTRHILEALQAELGISVIQGVNLILTSSSPQERSRTETITGNVVLNTEQQQQQQGIVSLLRLQTSVQQAFQGNALELFLFRLQIANDSALRGVTQIILGTSVPVPNSNGNNNDNGTGTDDDDEPSLSKVMIAIGASVVAALIALCCLAYCLVCRRHPGKGSSSRSRKSNRSTPHDNLPAVSTKPTISQDEEVAPVPNQQDDEENQSVGTSVYSYLNNNDDTLSAAPSFLYSIHEGDVSHDSAEEAALKRREKKGILWSVMDSFNSAFGNDDNNDTMLGRQEDDSRGSNGLLYDDDKSALTYDEKSMAYDDDNKSFLSTGVEQILSEEAARVAGTPVKQRFEALWKEEDEHDYLPTTVKKSNRTMIYEDEDGSENLDDQSDDSPSTLLGVHPMNIQPILVDRIPYDDDDKKLPLPSALNATSSVQQETYSETGSVGSNHSGNSSRSSRSSSSRPPFHPSNSDATASANVGSVRKKRNSNWSTNNISFAASTRSDKSVASTSNKSSTSARSTDSAKFRSLLSQADTNDAALFLHSSNASTENSEIPATKLSYDMPSPSNASAVQVTSLIQSFDKVWGREGENSNFGDQRLPFEHLDDKSVEDYYDDEKKEAEPVPHPKNTMASF